MKQKKRKGSAVVLALLALLIPVLLATLFLQSNASDNIKRGNVRSVTLVHGSREEEVTDAEEIAFFVKAAAESDPIQSPADELDLYRRLDVVFHKYNRDVAYTFYLSDSENNCLASDSNGNYFLFSPEVAKKLQSHRLLKDYALSFAEYPTLSLNQGGKDYAPCLIEGEWNHVRADGEDARQKIEDKSEEKSVLPQGEKLNFVFSIEPDYCSVLLTVKDGDILYSGKYTEMPVIHLDEDTPLSMTVSCDWYEKDNVSYHGSLSYSFDLTYDIPTLCALEKNSASPGGGFVLRVYHSASPQIAVTPSFTSDKMKVTKEEDHWLALIPVSQSATPGTYTIMVMGSDVEQTLDVTVTP